MNSQFIARYVALAALATGVSAPALAQSCPVDGSCPSGDFTQATQGAFDDAFGPAIAPFGPQTLMVPKFDVSAAAALHGVAPGQIVLRGVELTVTTTINNATVTYDNQNPNVGCDFDWTYLVRAGVEANAGLGIPEVVAQVNLAQTVSIPPSGNYAWNLLTDGPGVQSDTECLGTTTNLGAWAGAPGEMITFNTTSGAFDNDTSECGGLAKSYTNLATVEVEVFYRYCFESPDEPEVVCDCERPSPNYRRPGSLVLYPEFDNNPGSYTLVTVTNTDCIQNTGEDVQIEFKYIDKDGCAEFNKTEVLTPCDTLTVLTSAHNPNQDQGYLYVFAKRPDPSAPNGVPIAWDHLVGSLMVIQGLETGFDYSMNPVVFRSMQAAEGETTDLDGDGILDLDGLEYEPAPNLITIPRFLGQDGIPGKPGLYNSQLILIALTGGARFTTTACFTYYNDNEEIFSDEYSWECWDKPYLLDIGFGFSNNFLASTNNDPNEIFGAPNRESGWICVTGCIANSTQESIDNPAIYAALVEHVGAYGVADLPWECGIRTNGALLPRGVFGDPDVDTDGDGDVDEDDAVDGDNQ